MLNHTSSYSDAECVKSDDDKAVEVPSSFSPPADSSATAALADYVNKWKGHDKSLISTPRAKRDANGGQAAVLAGLDIKAVRDCNGG